MKLSSINIYYIQALIDNELGSEEEKRVCAYIDDSKFAREYYNSLLRQKQILQKWWKDTQK